MARSLQFKMLILFLFYFQRSEQSSLSFSFGTKTAYYFNDSVSSLKIPDGCLAQHINMVIRHGSRFPTDGDMEEIRAFLTKLHRIYTPSAPFRYVNLTLPWQTPTEWEHAEPGELSSVGEREQYDIAKRFRLRFPEIFEKPYWNRYYKFISSAKYRTVQSAAAFAQGIFEGEGQVGSSFFQPVAISSFVPEESDKLLSPDDSCPRYEAVVDELVGVEVGKFTKSLEMVNVGKRLEEKLQIAGKISLTNTDVEKIFRLCAFGIMNRGDNRWCSLLDESDMAVIEYQDDLENYYEHSYGIDLSYKIICVLLSDIIQTLKEFASGENQYQGIFRFTSSGTVTPLLTMLDLFKDPEPLRADNFKQQKNRQFRVANMVPMSANVAFVLYKCNSTEESGEVQHKVQVMVNEKVVGLPCCQGNKTCSLTKFLSCFDEEVKNCDFDAMCSVPAMEKQKALVPTFGPCFELVIFGVFLTKSLF